MTCNNCGHAPSEHDSTDLYQKCLARDCTCIGLSIPNWSYGEVR